MFGRVLLSYASDISLAARRTSVHERPRKLGSAVLCEAADAGCQPGELVAEGELPYGAVPD